MSKAHFLCLIAKISDFTLLKAAEIGDFASPEIAEALQFKILSGLEAHVSVREQGHLAGSACQYIVPEWTGAT